MSDINLPAVSSFRKSVSDNLFRFGYTSADVAQESDPLEKRLFGEYGAVFLTRATPPATVMFESESEVLSFQSFAGNSQESMDGAVIELQPAAMEALRAARAKAASKGLSISPRDGAEAGRRSYQKTVLLWESRFKPALDYWQSKGRLAREDVQSLISLPVREQVAAVLAHEETGIYFNTFFNNSILFSVAAPGTSQHLSMLAFDVKEYSDLKIQKIMADFGWFRTVQNDSPHFTFLGIPENQLEVLGLKKVSKNDGDFWIPDI